MGERHERLTTARRKAGFRSAMAAAKKHHWPTSTYASHENGQTPLPQDAAAKYAKAFKVSTAWLLTGEGEMQPRKGLSAGQHPRTIREAKARFVEMAERVPADKLDLAIDYLEFLMSRR